MRKVMLVIAFSFALLALVAAPVFAQDSTATASPSASATATSSPSPSKAQPTIPLGNGHGRGHAYGQAKRVIEADSPLPVEGVTSTGGTVDGTLQNATIAVDPATEVATVEGTLVGTAETASGVDVPIQEPVSETVDLSGQTSGTSCSLGYITLDGTLTVDLLGLKLLIDELDVQLQGDSSEGLLGNLLCGLAGSGSTLPNI